MVFKCQEDSFLKEFTSKVVSCNKADFEVIIDGKKNNISGYEVILEDTILFPEGGGQPHDLGYLGTVPVLSIIRRGADAIHYVKEAFTAGEVVQQTVEWDRRFDHMQQHSGQHFISAVIEREYNVPTVAWWLGEDTCHVELDTPAFTIEQIARTEQILNEYIAAATPITVTILDKNASEEEINKIRARGLPEDHVGDIRVINIHGVDENMCCGTHVKNLSQLQMIKLLHTEKSKRKNKTLLHFIIGNRVMKRLTTCLDREQKITILLNNGPAEHVDLVEKLLKNSKVALKNLQVVLKDVAIAEVKKLKEMNPAPKYHVIHKKEGDADFINNFLREMGKTEIFLFLAVGDDKTGGNIVLYGKEDDIAKLGNKICEILDGKGAGKGNRFQAKVSKIINVPKAVKLIKDNFE